MKKQLSTVPYFKPINNVTNISGSFLVYFYSHECQAVHHILFTLTKALILIALSNLIVQASMFFNKCCNISTNVSCWKLKSLLKHVIVSSFVKISQNQFVFNFVLSCVFFIRNTSTRIVSNIILSHYNIICKTVSIKKCIDFVLKSITRLFNLFCCCVELPSVINCLHAQRDVTIE